MSANSKIEWTDHTFNPWEGCTKVSPGCANCYAEARNHRWGLDNWGKGKPRRRTSAANWKQPLKWNRDAGRDLVCNLCGGPVSTVIGYCNSCWNEKYTEHLEKKHDRPLYGVLRRRPRVFCASLADVFDEEVPDDWRDDLFELIYKTKNLDWLLLTKRPEKARDYLWGESGAGANHIRETWNNVRLGITAENQEQLEKRLPVVISLDLPNFISYEPALGPLDLERVDFSCIDWLICGGESGPRKRPFDLAWARSVRGQCRAAGIPFFMKQIDKVQPIPDDLMIRQFPK